MPSLQDKEDSERQLIIVKEANVSLTSDLTTSRSEVESATAKASSLQQECQELQSQVQKQSQDAEARQQTWAETTASKDKALQAST